MKKGYSLSPIIILEPELVVLAAGFSPPDGTDELSRILGIECSPDSGFFSPDEFVLDPTGSAHPGIYIAGTALAPKDINDCVNQAESAAMKAFIDTLPKEDLGLGHD